MHKSGTVSASDQRIKDNIKEDHEERFLKAFEEYNDALFRHAFLRVSDRDRAIDIGFKERGTAYFLP